MKKEYRIGRRTYYQKELTWGQDEKLIKLIEVLTGTGGDEDLNIANLHNILLKYKMVDHFFYIVLWPKKNLNFFLWRIWDFIKWTIGRRKGHFNIVDLKHASNSAVDSMFSDFFLLNQALIERLGNFGQVVQLIFQSATEAPAATETATQKPRVSTDRKKTRKKKQPAGGSSGS